jgi:hypothetical protein
MLTPHTSKKRSRAADSDYWRLRANEVRAVSEQMHDKLSSEMMLRLAADYDRIAQNVEERELAQRATGRSYRAIT